MGKTAEADAASLRATVADFQAQQEITQKAALSTIAEVKAEADALTREKADLERSSKTTIDRLTLTLGSAQENQSRLEQDLEATEAKLAAESEAMAAKVTEVKTLKADAW